MGYVSIDFQLLKLRQGLLDLTEVGEICGSFEDLCVANNPHCIDDKGRSFRHPMHVEYKSIVEAVIFFGDFLVEIAEQGEIQLLVVLIPGQGEEGVYADTEHLGVDLVIEGDIVAHAAKFLGAGASEGLGEEEDENIFAFEIVQTHLFLFGIIEAEFGCWLSDLNC